MFADMRQFLGHLERHKRLARVASPVSARLEITEICRRAIIAQGPALLFESVDGGKMPVVGNLFGTRDRVLQAIGLEDSAALRSLGELLGRIKEPRWPRDAHEVAGHLPIIGRLWAARPRLLREAAPVQECVHEGAAVGGTDGGVLRVLA